MQLRRSTVCLVYILLNISLVEGINRQVYAPQVRLFFSNLSTRWILSQSADEAKCIYPANTMIDNVVYALFTVSPDWEWDLDLTQRSTAHAHEIDDESDVAMQWDMNEVDRSKGDKRPEFRWWTLTRLGNTITANARVMTNRVTRGMLGLAGTTSRWWQRAGWRAGLGESIPNLPFVIIL